jgi:hypothetical protein
MAGGGGFEPPLAEPKSAVLPLDDPPEYGTTRKVCLSFFLPVRALECKPFVSGAMVRRWTAREGRHVRAKRLLVAIASTKLGNAP